MKSSTWMAAVLVTLLPIASVHAEGGEITVVEGASVTIDDAPRTFTLHLVDDDHEHRIALGLGSLGTIGITSGDVDAVVLPRFKGAQGFVAHVYIDSVLRAKFEPPGRLIALSPQGRRLDQAFVTELAAERRIVLLCGRYEGFDERIIEELKPEAVSI